jgi:hypothetical protein
MYSHPSESFILAVSTLPVFRSLKYNKSFSNDIKTVNYISSPAPEECIFAVTVPASLLHSVLRDNFKQFSLSPSLSLSLSLPAGKFS